MNYAAEAEGAHCLVTIGASGALGLQQIAEVLASLPPNLDAAVLVVLHRLVDHQSYLREVADGIKCALLDGTGNQHRNRTVDLLYRSASLHSGSRLVGVILAGSLDDGCAGIADIYDAGGQTIVVRPETGAAGGMPRSAINCGRPVHVIAPAHQVAMYISAAVANLSLPTVAMER